MIDYLNGKIYCIRRSNDSDKIVYVGSTVRPLSERMAQHRSAVKHHPTRKIYKLIAEVGVEHFYIELLNPFPCDNCEALLAEEGRLIRLHKTNVDGANGNVAGRSREEHYKENRDRVLEYKKAYYETHKDQKKAYYERKKAEKRLIQSSQVGSASSS